MGVAPSAAPLVPNDLDSVAVRLKAIISQRPSRVGDNLRLIAILSDFTVNEKQQLIRLGVLSSLLDEIGRCCSGGAFGEERRRSKGWRVRRPSTPSISTKGIGYGRGSTKSRWDIERTVEERIAREEHLMWILCILTALLYGDSLKLSDPNQFSNPQTEILLLSENDVEEIISSPIYPLLEYHLANDSVFDVSQHMDFYQSLMELIVALCCFPKFLRNLIVPKNGESKSIAKELIPRFRNTLNQYPRFRGQSSPDFALMDFIRKINDLSDVVDRLVSRFDGNLFKIESPPKNTELYSQYLSDFQIQTYGLIGDDGKPLFGFAFRRELCSVKPFAPSLKERTKRIAKELASMQSCLPLNASNSIFVCVDESRCDVLKVLISGPDETPYESGLFAFDVFFPSDYPYSPPKFEFLTTGSGTVRFNPNLYSDGKICLSILGSWDGRPEEQWSPHCSLLQVLISIQGLIFVRQPYFNEPGFEKLQYTERGEECSRMYNLHVESATMLFAILQPFHNPPPYFKNVIRRHFQMKRDSIMEMGRKWLGEIGEQRPLCSEPDPFDPTDVLFPNPAAHIRNVQNLIAEFAQMPIP